jgi:hypothetical protein
VINPTPTTKTQASQQSYPPEVLIVAVPRVPHAADDRCYPGVVDAAGDVGKGAGEEGDPTRLVLHLDTHSIDKSGVSRASVQDLSG